jgi:DNA-binding XRE family transcriptional regulator
MCSWRDARLGESIISRRILTTTVFVPMVKGEQALAIEYSRVERPVEAEMKEPVSVVFARNLRDLMREKFGRKATQSLLAKRSGVSQTTISKILRARGRVMLSLPVSLRLPLKSLSGWLPSSDSRLGCFCTRIYKQ